MNPQERYKKLKEHLKEENPVLVDAIEEYEKLDKIAKKAGFLEENKTYTEEISWWPLISILGTFSAGKSSFINEYLGKKVQNTGNQAVDDKFSVICYSKNQDITTLPGVALDADPRFPFYNISKEIEKLDENENNINRYLQLKAVNSENIKGKILIDSPGFDADIQRDETLKITKHIINLSDLVLIFFDARHPEPGAMRDTLNHLVEVAKSHKDSDKILYILNQIDTCAKEDNLEDIIGAWQRALSQKGIVSGKFYAIYNESAANLEDYEQKDRLKKKRDEDLKEILEKIDKVAIDRSYRIVKNIKTKSKQILEKLPKLKEKLTSFRNTVLTIDILLIAGFGAAYIFILNINLPLYLSYGLAVIFIALFIFFHFKAKSIVSKFMAKRIEDDSLKSAFVKNTKWYKLYLFAPSKALSKKITDSLNSLIENSNRFIQKLNDQFISLKHQKEA